MASIYERLGGSNCKMDAVVSHWYDLLLADGCTKKPFEDRVTDVEKTQCNLGAFLVKALGGPDHYKGKDIKEFHKEFEIRQEQFDALWKHLETSLQLHKAPEHCIKEIKELVYSLQTTIVNTK